MKDKFVITIGRQFGSGGRDIGMKLAEKLGVKCYDKELISLAAQESGMCKEIMEMHDEKVTNSFLYSLVMDSYAGMYNAHGIVDVPINQKVFLAQFDTIKKIADKESCIFVGRCADYALEDEKNVTNVFVSADLEKRIERISDRFKMPESKAKDKIIKVDKKRAGYYNYYTNKIWGEASAYDLCINTTKISIDKAVDIILSTL